jgi:hypothetical protein
MSTTAVSMGPRVLALIQGEEVDGKTLDLDARCILVRALLADTHEELAESRNRPAAAGATRRRWWWPL